MHLSDNGKLYAVVAAGALLRLLLFCSESLTLTASRRLELSTPVTSWLSRELAIPDLLQASPVHSADPFMQSKKACISGNKASTPMMAKSIDRSANRCHSTLAG